MPPGHTCSSPAAAGSSSASGCPSRSRALAASEARTARRASGATSYEAIGRRSGSPRNRSWLQCPRRTPCSHRICLLRTVLTDKQCWLQSPQHPLQPWAT
jgi:hypothetical protein